MIPDAAFIVNTGDIVENINEAAIPFYFDYAREITANYAFVYSMGNNDSVNWYNKYFYTPKNGNSTLYSFDYGNAHFINIDSNNTLTTAQLTWLENDLKNTVKKWKVVMTHQADYGRSGNNTAITKLLDKYNVDLVMAGHNHFYARSKPINTEGKEKQNGTVWIIPNTAGTKFNPVSGQSYLAVDKQPNMPMFTEFRFTETNIELKSYIVYENGTVTLFDSYSFR
jgi:predicted phosphodiesterase